MNKSWPVFLIAVSLIVTGATARADDAKPGVSKMESLMAAPAGMAVSDADDDSVIRITPDKTKILRLTQDASSVIVTNPANLSVLLDSPRLLIIMPRTPGTTSFTVLNNKGQTIAEKTVIVAAAAKPKYVRIRRVCDAGGSSCVPTAYFYCPDGCYEVMTVPPDNGATNVPDVPANPVAIETNQPGQSMDVPIRTAPPPAPTQAPVQAPAPQPEPEEAPAPPRVTPQ